MECSPRSPRASHDGDGGGGDDGNAYWQCLKYLKFPTSAFLQMIYAITLLLEGSSLAARRKVYMNYRSNEAPSKEIVEETCMRR